MDMLSSNNSVQASDWGSQDALWALNLPYYNGTKLRANLEVLGSPFSQRGLHTNRKMGTGVLILEVPFSHKSSIYSCTHHTSKLNFSDMGFEGRRAFNPSRYYIISERLWYMFMCYVFFLCCVCICTWVYVYESFKFLHQLPLLSILG